MSLRQPGHLAKEGIAMMTGGLGDGWETCGHGDLIIPDELMTFDLQQLSLSSNILYCSWV